MTNHVHPDAIRTQFSSAMSDMYRAEVPQYGTLVELVRDVNAATLARDPELKERLAATGELDRLDVERHGAIRLGTADELSMIRRMFAVMGMFPVGYYDLSVAGIPVHAKAFRPIYEASLSCNPFRVFTSLLRLDLIEDRDLATKAEQILDARQIVTPRAKEMISIAEVEGGLSDHQSRTFVAEALETFRWHSEATVNAVTYGRLVAAHRLIADVVSFKGPHINHLTPRTLDIDAVQTEMPARGITPKAVIEGPPRRHVDILLRQTSFRALEETVTFDGTAGRHTARFGEIEQRGVALTPAGRAQYDKALADARLAAAKDGGAIYDEVLKMAFAKFSDDLETLRTRGLAFFQYRISGKPFAGQAKDLNELLVNGTLIADPQVYEDFLPVSAAGIFQSNLGEEKQSNHKPAANKVDFEAALGAEVLDEMALYAEREATSLTNALTELGQDHLLTVTKAA